MRRVIRFGGEDRQYKLCRCARCETEEKCTRTFDFYTKPGDEKGPLYCYACLCMETNTKPDPKEMN